MYICYRAREYESSARSVASFPRRAPPPLNPEYGSTPIVIAHAQKRMFAIRIFRKFLQFSPSMSDCILICTRFPVYIYVFTLKKTLSRNSLVGIRIGLPRT